MNDSIEALGARELEARCEALRSTVRILSREIEEQKCTIACLKATLKETNQR